MKIEQNSEGECVDAGAASFVGLINELGDIRGYKASAILTYEGELLYSNTTDRVNQSDLGMQITAYNSLFGHACGLSEKSGFASCTEVTLRSGREIVVIRCSGKNCLVGIRLFVLIEELGNIALMQRQLGSILPRLMKCLTWEPDNLVPLYMGEAAWGRGNAKIAQDN